MDSGRVVRLPTRANELIDLNRAGIPLIEIVTSPGLQTPSDAVSFVEQLRLLLACNGVCTGEMHSNFLFVCFIPCKYLYVVADFKNLK